jgi:hypothetical protein
MGDGGYGEQRVDRPYHQVYDPASNRWTDAPPLPKGANHVGVAVLDGRLHAIGGFVEQNRKSHNECFALHADRPHVVAMPPLDRRCLRWSRSRSGCPGRSGENGLRKGWRTIDAQP